MKKHILPALLALLLSIAAQAQSCLPNGITLTHQSQIDNFAANYPGCTVIQGDLTLDESVGGGDIFDLNGLSVLTEVTGNLAIRANELSNLHGLHNLTAVGGRLDVIIEYELQNLEGLTNLTTIGGELGLTSNSNLTSLHGMDNLASMGSLNIGNCGMLTNLSGLENVGAIRGLYVQNNDNITDLSGLPPLDTFQFPIIINENPLLSSLAALKGLRFVKEGIILGQNVSLTNLSGLDSLRYIGERLHIQDNSMLTTLEGLNYLRYIGGEFTLAGNTPIADFNGLEQLDTIGQNLNFSQLSVANFNGLGNLKYVGGQVTIQNCNFLTDFTGLTNLTTFGKGVYIGANNQLASLSGLDQLRSVGLELVIEGNPALASLHGLEGLNTIGTQLHIQQNTTLTSLDGLENLYEVFGNIRVVNNPALSDCAIYAICDKLQTNPTGMVVGPNAAGCNSPAEIQPLCLGAPTVKVTVLADNNGDCLPDAGDSPADGVHVRLNGSAQMLVMETGADGVVRFKYPENSAGLISLPQFPNAHWAVCQEPVAIQPGNPQDTITATLLLSPLDQCADLTVNLNLPRAFRDCTHNSAVQISVRNTGTAMASNAVARVVMPPVFELLGSVPPLAGQVGDTLFFELGNLMPLTAAAVELTVKTACDTVLTNRALCWEAFADSDNSCPDNLPPHSEIRLSAACIGNDSIRFTLKNIGDAPTQSPHEYSLIRNATLQSSFAFSLNAQENRTVTIPADGATYRMEATKFDDGTLTAVSHEGCGGFAAGWVTAFWQEKGGPEYDFDCRQVLETVYPNQKTVFPVGAGFDYLVAPNQPAYYTINFQNAESDTVHRVRIRDILPSGLNVNTFRPGHASHPFTWKISEDNLLEVAFENIDLPPAATNDAASRGFFSFAIDQNQDLANGTQLVNTAYLFFDNDPPFWTYAANTIGALSSQSQPCAIGNISLNTQEQVDNFSNTFQGCEIIDGSMYIEGGNISNLNGLLQLTDITGALSLLNCLNLTDLSGLNNLRSVDHLYILFNPALESLHGLESLQAVHGNFEIASNNTLETMGSLNELDSVGGYLYIRNNAMLQRLDGLSQLTTVADSIYLTNNPMLAQLNGFQQLESVGGSFNIQNNGSLLSIAELDSLTTVGKNFIIQSNAALADFGNMNKLQAIGGDLSIGGNPALTHLSGMKNLKTIENTLEIGGNNGLLDITGFDSLMIVGKDFNIASNLSLTNAGNFGHLTEVGGSFEIRYHFALTQINGFNRLTTIGDFVRLRQNYAATSISGFENLTSIAGQFWMIENEAMVNLSGFDQLQTIGGDLWILRNYQMEEMGGFSNLHTIEGSLALNENSALTNMTALSQLDTIRGNVSIAGNSLINLTSLGDLDFIGGNMHLYSCPALTNLNGLENLHTAVNGVTIEACNALETLSGLDNLETVAAIEVLANPSLTSLGSLGNVVQLPGTLTLKDNPQLLNLEGLDKLTASGDLRIDNNDALLNLAQLSNLEGVSGQVWIMNNAALTDLTGLEKLETIGQDLNIYFNDALTNLSALSKLKIVWGSAGISYNPLLTNLGLDSLATIGNELYLVSNASLENLSGLSQLAYVSNNLAISDNAVLTSLEGLNRLSACYQISIGNNPSLERLNSFDSLREVGNIWLFENNLLQNLDGFENLNTVYGTLSIGPLASLSSVEELSNLTSVNTLSIQGNPALISLDGLGATAQIGQLIIESNDLLTSLSGLGSHAAIGAATIRFNPQLSECAIAPVCLLVRSIFFPPNITANAPGCDSPEEIKDQCGPVPVTIVVKTDPDGDCIPDANNVPQAEVQVVFQSNGQTVLKPTDTSGVAHFEYLDGGFINFQLTQYPTNLWAVCPFNPLISTDTLTQTSIEKEILLAPIPQCPELKVDLALPSNFRSCLVESQVQVSAQNMGTISAEGVVLAVVVPAVMEVLDTDYPIASQTGDTLFFDLGEIAPLSGINVLLTVRTNCDTFLIDHTLCWEASAIAGNPCPDNHPPRFETQITAQCLGDTTVRFTLTNIGDAPMPEPFLYTLIRNADIIQTGFFDLAIQQSIEINVPADGATYRVQAPKHGDGSFAASAIENCGGLTPGLITAHWLDEGPLPYDFDCRQVIGSFDPNQKTAIPTGAGPNHIIAANRPLQYTIDFQNTGTDTAFRVLLRDVLPAGLNISTFRPAFASHPYSWEIRGMDTLEVLFFPIALPDSNVNEPASHGFFTFEIDQFVNHPDGVIFENTAAIVFDFNPPIITNTVVHTIGSLIVTVDEPQPQRDLWRVAGNPTRTMATFSAVNPTPGVKRFELFDTGGRLVRLARFEGQSFEFHRESLAAGMYFFSIADERGRRFGGKIVVVD